MLFQEVRFLEAGSAEAYRALDVELGGQIKLLGYRLSQESPTPGVAYPMYAETVRGETGTQAVRVE